MFGFDLNRERLAEEAAEKAAAAARSKPQALKR
jgi:hypothetical protein